MADDWKDFSKWVTSMQWNPPPKPSKKSVTGTNYPHLTSAELMRLARKLGIGVGEEVGETTDPPDLPEEETDTPIVGYRAWNVVEHSHRTLESGVSGGRCFCGWGHMVLHHPTNTYVCHSCGATYSFAAVQMAVSSRPDPDTSIPEGWLLVSPTQSTKWTSPILRADGEPCSYDPHDSRWKSREDHCHGIYAHDTPEWSDFHSSGYVRAMGRVELTGKVVVHEDGYRAEAARITRLVLNPYALDKEGVAEGLADRYACDVTFDPTQLTKE